MSSEPKDPRCQAPENSDSDSEDEATTMEIPSSGEVVVPATDEPPPAPPGKTIHRRRPLPPVKEPDD
jgi:hypothetical protein